MKLSTIKPLSVQGRMQKASRRPSSLARKKERVIPREQILGKIAVVLKDVTDGRLTVINKSSGTPVENNFVDYFASVINVQLHKINGQFTTTKIRKALTELIDEEKPSSPSIFLEEPRALTLLRRILEIPSSASSFRSNGKREIKPSSDN